MDGKYLAEARRELVEAQAQGVSPEEHSLRSLAALTEAVTELEARVKRIEGGPAQWPQQVRTPEDP